MAGFAFTAIMLKVRAMHLFDCSCAYHELVVQGEVRTCATYAV